MISGAALWGPPRFCLHRKYGILNPWNANKQGPGAALRERTVKQ